MSRERNIKNIFREGAIPAEFIGSSIAAHQSKTQIGGHSIFLGQVRADNIRDKKVIAIDYTSYTEMALEKMHELRELIISKYALSCLHVYHSLGRVDVGQICLFVFTSAPHRRAAIDACSELVELIKKELPVWGKEILDDEDHQWKVNS